jgi:hypothetical protein
MPPRRCPLCRRVSEGHTRRCDCGYTFGQSLGDARALVKQQLGAGIATAAGGALLVTLAVGLVALSIAGSHLVALTAFAGGLAGLVKGSTLITRSRHSLRELPDMPIARALPGERD